MKWTFLNFLKAFYVSGVVFAKDHPKLTKIGNFVLKTDDEDLKKRTDEKKAEPGQVISCLCS